MADEQQEKKKPKRPPIGGIQQYATIGGGRKKFDAPDVLSPDHFSDEALKPQDALASEQQDATTLSSQSDKTLKRQEDEMLNQQSVIATEHQNVLALNSQSAKTLELQDDKELKRQTVYLPKRLALWLKSHAALTEQDMSEIITKLVEDYQRKEEA